MLNNFHNLSDILRLFIILIFFVSAIGAQEKLPVVKSNSHTVSIQNGGELRENAWRLAPEAKPDVYEADLIDGKTTQHEQPQTNDSKLAQIRFSALLDFNNDVKNHRLGERFIINDIPPGKIDKRIDAESFGGADYKNLFYLEESDDDGYIGNSLLTSAALIKKLPRRTAVKPRSLRAYAILVQTGDGLSIVRGAFITKIEAIGKSGKTLWTADGAEPMKLKFKH